MTTNDTTCCRSTPRMLFEEWDRLSRNPRVRRQLARWDLPGGPAGDLDDVLVRAGFGGPREDDMADAVLHRLVVLANEGDQLAARVVLQRILPGLVSIARRRAPWARLSPGAAFDEVVGAAWLVIRTFPADRRTRRLAANVLRDTEYQAFVRPRRLRWANLEVPASDVCEPAPACSDDPAVVVTDDPARRLADLLTRARRAGLAKADVELASALGRGATTVEVARQLGVTDRAVRARRAVLIRRLQEVVAVA